MAEWTITLGNKPLESPASLADSLVDYPFRDELPLWQLANSYECPTGREAGRAFVLIRRDRLEDLDKNAYHSLVWKNLWETVTIKSLVIVEEPLVMYGRSVDTTAPMLVQLADRRHVMSRSPVYRNYNCRMPAPKSTATDEEHYYTESLDAGSLWTWDRIIEDLWDEMTDALTAPTVPSPPATDPGEIRLRGLSALDAACNLLEAINRQLVYNPIADSFSIVVTGATQSGLSTAETALVRKQRLRQDFDPPSGYNAGNFPATVKVFFPRWDRWRGTELDTPRDDNWEMTDYTVETASTGIENAKGTWAIPPHYLALKDNDDPDQNVDAAAIAAKLAELAADLAKNTKALRHKVWAGATGTLLPGSQLSNITWRDYGDYDQNLGQLTITDYEASLPGLAPIGHTPDRRAQYPGVLQLVRVNDTGGGAVVNPVSGVLPTNSGETMWLHEGEVTLLRDGMETLDPCWIYVVDCFSTFAGNLPLVNGAIMWGRLSGTARVVPGSGSGAADERPLYAVAAEREFDGVIDEPDGIVDGGSGTVDITSDGVKVSPSVSITSHYVRRTISDLPDGTGVLIRLKTDVCRFEIEDHGCV